VDVLEAVAIFAAGVGAGSINAAVGSGTLITFPTLLAFGYPPVVANVSNTVGLVPGSVSGAHVYRRELAGQGRRVVRFGLASLAGAVAGAVLLLVLPESAFRAIVPVFIGLALVLVVVQRRLSAFVAARREGHHEHGRIATAAVAASGAYGGYFGAAQGIMLIAILGLATDDDLQRVNALKNVLAGLVNLVSGLIFVVAADVAWGAALAVALGSTVGGQLGGRLARRLPPAVLRAVIVAVGIITIVRLLT
jgi:uncharacterized membrane protein YfcA